MKLETKKLGVLELYNLTQKILSTATSPELSQKQRLERSSYFEEKRKEHFESMRHELQYLIDTMEYQISHYYPRLRSLFMPRAVVKEYSFGKVREIIPPLRWEEPLVQYFLKEFRELMLEPDKHIGINNEDINSDLVYSQIRNPDIRRSILQRRMGKEQYEKLERLLRISEPLTSDIQLQQTRALEVIPSREIVPFEEAERLRLDSLPPEILAIEAGLTAPTVKKHREVGLTGQEIVDEGFMIGDKTTNALLIHELRRYEVPEDQWSELIDLARQIQQPVAFLLRVMDDIGTKDAEELMALVDDMSDTVGEFVEEHRMNRQKAWYLVMGIYSGEGRGNIDRTLDIFTGHYWANVTEEAFVDAWRRSADRPFE